jgi:hypothetical protein
MWVGVAKAGHSVAEEAPMFAVVFAVPGSSRGSPRVESLPRLTDRISSGCGGLTLSGPRPRLSLPDLSSDQLQGGSMLAMRRLRSRPHDFLAPLFLLGCDHAALSPGESLDPPLARVGPGGIAFELRPKARLLADGSVRLRVVAGCPSGLAVLEAFVTVSQAGAFGEAFLPADCTGKAEKHWVTVTALEGSFEPGQAVVSGILLAEDPTTLETEQAQDTETVALR